jgi:uncharacterized protein involved in response to NO
MTLLRVRSIADWPLLSAGFRPFFLLGACYAGLGILVWMPAFHGRLALATGFAPRDWHIHEMLFGFMSAVVTGFLFTAIPNWTGRLPIRGLPLLGWSCSGSQGGCVTFRPIPAGSQRCWSM